MDAVVIDAAGRVDTLTPPETKPVLLRHSRRGLKIAMIVPPYFDIPPTAYGGVESVAADLTNALVEAGQQVTLIGAGVNGTKGDFVPVWEETIPHRLGETFPEIAHAALAREAVENLAHSRGVDVVHDHTTAGPLNAAFYASLGIPTVVTVHGPVTGDLLHLYATLRTNIGLVAISHHQRRLAPDLPWLATVHNGLSLPDWPFQAGNEGYALFLGRFHPDKGAHLALEAAHAAGMPLVLAGKCSEPAERAYYEQHVAHLLRPADRMVGMADAAMKRVLLANARCLIFPIQWEEPFGMVMIEAMACGTPVVALGRGAVTEVVTHGETGFICHHPDELPAALRQVDQLDAAACRRRVAEHFSSAGLAAGYISAYHRAVADTSAAVSASPFAPVATGVPVPLN